MVWQFYIQFLSFIGWIGIYLTVFQYNSALVHFLRNLFHTTTYFELIFSIVMFLLSLPISIIGLVGSKKMTTFKEATHTLASINLAIFIFVGIAFLLYYLIVRALITG